LLSIIYLVKYLFVSVVFNIRGQVGLVVLFLYFINLTVKLNIGLTSVSVVINGLLWVKILCKT